MAVAMMAVAPPRIGKHAGSRRTQGKAAAAKPKPKPPPRPRPPGRPEPDDEPARAVVLMVPRGLINR